MDDDTPIPWWRTRTGVALVGFGLVAAFYLLREHYGHAVGALPYLLLLACPLMHLFMHHRHQGDHRRGPAGAPQDPAAQDHAGMAHDR